MGDLEEDVVYNALRNPFVIAFIIVVVAIALLTAWGIIELSRTPPEIPFGEIAWRVC